MYIWELSGWPGFRWKQNIITSLLAETRFAQGRLLGQMSSLGFDLQNAASLNNITTDVLRSSEIEGEMYDPNQVRSSVAKRLGINIGGPQKIDRNIEGAVNVLIDVTSNYLTPLSSGILKNWQASLLPTSSMLIDIRVGDWRNDSHGPMQVVSGPIGREKVHFEAPPANLVPKEMASFVSWFNDDNKLDNILKAAIAHLWFVTIHPFEDGNGRIARALADKLMARADGTNQRFYSISQQICIHRKEYYDELEKTQKGDLNITSWLNWFLNCVKQAITESEKTLVSIKDKARFWERTSQQALNERQIKILNKLLEDFEGKLTSTKWAKLSKCSQDTANRDINDLISRGILEKNPHGGRSTSYRVKES